MLQGKTNGVAHWIAISQSILVAEMRLRCFGEQFSFP
jgi:hypothetical protein